MRRKASRDDRSVALGSVAGIALRRGMLPWAALIMVGLEIQVMLSRGAQWRGDSVWTVDWISVSFIAVAPILAAALAVDTARLTHGMAHLSLARRLRRPEIALFVTYAVLVATIHLGVASVGLAFSWRAGIDPYAWLAVAVHLALLWFFLALGSLCGRLAGPALAGICAAVLSFAALFLFSSGAVSLLGTGIATVPRVGYRYSPTSLLVQFAGLGLLTVALLGVRPRPSELGSGRLDGRQSATLAVALVLSLGLSALGPMGRLTTDAIPPQLCGAAQTIPTCFYPQHARVADSFTAEFWTVIQLTRDAGYEDLLPTRVDEVSRTWAPTDPQGGIFIVTPEHLAGEPPTPTEIIYGLTQPLHCPQLQTDQPPSAKYGEDLHSLIATWVGLIDPALREAEGGAEHPLTTDEAAHLMHEFRTCTYSHFTD